MYGKRTRAQEERSFHKLLKLRAWVFHASYTCLRIYNWAAKETIWLRDLQKPCVDVDVIEQNQVEEETTDCLNVDFKYDIVAQIKPYVAIACMALVIIAIIIDIASLKWHGLIDYIMHVDLFYILLIHLIPSD